MSADGTAYHMLGGQRCFCTGQTSDRVSGPRLNVLRLQLNARGQQYRSTVITAKAGPQAGYDPSAVVQIGSGVQSLINPARQDDAGPSERAYGGSPRNPHGGKGQRPDHPVRPIGKSRASHAGPSALSALAGHRCDQRPETPFSAVPAAKARNECVMRFKLTVIVDE